MLCYSSNAPQNVSRCTTVAHDHVKVHALPSLRVTARAHLRRCTAWNNSGVRVRGLGYFTVGWLLFFLIEWQAE